MKWLNPIRLSLIKLAQSNEYISEIAIWVVRKKNNFTTRMNFYSTSPLPNAIDSVAIKKYNEHRFLGARKKVCYAPFNNLYIGLEGVVSVCCYNKHYVLGKYPQNSIEAIWRGDKLQKLQEHISGNDFTLGCQKCAVHILNENYEGLVASTYDYFVEEQPLMPTRMEFEMSNTCNLECVMCNGVVSSTIRKNREKQEAIKEVYDENFITQIKPFIPFLSYTKFLGGEPFLIKQYYEIWDSIIVLNPSCLINITTNATILNQRVKTLLQKGNFSINISIDAISKERYEAIRIHANFEHVMDNIQYFKNYTVEKGTPINFCFCPMRSNWQEIPSFVHFANRYDALMFFNTVLEPHHEALWTLPANVLQEMLYFFQSKSFPTNNFKQKKNKKVYDDFLNSLISWHSDSLTRESQSGAYRYLDTNNLKNKVVDKVYAFVKMQEPSPYYKDLSKEEIFTMLEKKISSQNDFSIEKYLQQMMQYDTERLLVDLYVFHRF